MRRLMVLLLAVLTSATFTISAQTQKPLDPNRWESTIQKFEADDKQQPPAKGGIVFIGASSIARWTNLAESFPDLPVINRGFGGSDMADAVKYAARVVIPYAPRTVVLYSGENELTRGTTPETIASDFTKFHDLVRAPLPQTNLIVVGLKPSPLRWDLREGMHETNRLIRARCAAMKMCTYVDVWPSMIGGDGLPKPELYVEDRLHMTPAGYKAWTALLRPHLK